jgi:uncharacterized membrane-anchored protein YjiN (DUF445 family)
MSKVETAITSSLPLILDDLAHDESVYVRCEVACNKNTTPETLSKLAKDTNSSVRCWVADNHNTPPEVLSTLLTDFSGENTLFHLAKNPHTPIETLRELANNKGWWCIRRNVAENTSTTADILDKLADDEERCVRFTAASNKNMPTNTLIRMFISSCEHREDNVLRDNILHNPSCPTVIKIWTLNNGFAGLTFAEFIESVSNEQKHFMST